MTFLSLLSRVAKGSSGSDLGNGISGQLSRGLQNQEPPHKPISFYSDSLYLKSILYVS